MNATHKHVYVGLAVSDENVQETRQWVSGLDAPQYARLIDLLSKTATNREHDSVLNELRAPTGEARGYLHVMDMHGTAIDGHTCPQCPR